MEEESEQEIGFADLGVEPELEQILKRLGFAKPLAVQRAAIPVIAQGRDVSLRAKTGSGKTAAFGIPLIQRLEPKRETPWLLVLAPTRELAGQLARDLEAIGQGKRIRVAAVYGGLDMERQLKLLRGRPQIVVATPGRLLDVEERGALQLDTFEVVVLDEADEMLSLGFYEDVTRILEGCRACGQLIILSASLNERTSALVDRYTREVVRIDLSADRLSVEGIRNVYYEIDDKLPRHRYLLHVLAVENPQSAIVFANTRQDVSLLGTVLAREGWQAEVLSGSLPQGERERVMQAIRQGKLRIMVATDLAARGIDISHLTHVINYSLPEDPALFLHRVGRTGRVERSGTAVSLVSAAKLRTLKTIERSFGIRFERRVFPPPQEISRQRRQAHLEELKRRAENAVADGFLDEARELLDRPDAPQLVAYLLRCEADRVHDQMRHAENQPLSASSRPSRTSRPRRPRKGRR